MMSNDYKDMDIQLELKDRINYPHILMQTIMNIKKYMAKEDSNPERLENLLWDFFTDIPHDWYDDKFLKEMRQSLSVKMVDVRPNWGGVKLNKERCEELGYEIYRKKVVVNPFLLKNAIINLLHRRNMLVRKKKIEKSTGVNLEYDDVEDLPEEPKKKKDIVKKDVRDDKIIKEIKSIEKEDKGGED